MAGYPSVWMDQTGGDAMLDDSVLCILIWGACREGCGKEQHGGKGIQLEKKKAYGTMLKSVDH